MRWFPYEPRPFQAEACAIVAQTARQGGHLAFEAGTGTGKTVTLLAGALDAAAEADLRVLYVTRTNSQQQQAIRELEAIRKASGQPLRAVAVQGRTQLCLKLEDEPDPEWERSTAEELSHFCSQAKKATESEPGSSRACRWYGGLLALDEERLRAVAGEGARTAEAFKDVGRAHGFCSYEASKRLLPEARVVVAPYVFAFDPMLRARLFQWWGTTPDRTILVVDEAHNVPGYLRELFSPGLTHEALKRAFAESEHLGHPVLGPGLPLRSVLDHVTESLERIVVEFTDEDDGFVPSFELEMDLLGQFRTTSPILVQAWHAMAQLGEVVKDRKRLLGKVPRSYLSHVATFLLRWFSAEDGDGVKLAARSPRPRLEVFCVDATGPARALHDFHATVHASGTLAPLEEYRDTIGLGEEARLERFPTPFDPGQLSVVAVRGLTTRYERLKQDPALADQLQDAARRFLEAARVNTAIFFPSHRMMEEFDEVGALRVAGAQVLKEERSMGQDALMAMVQSHRGPGRRSHLVAVSGGRLSEGMDFPGSQLEAELVVGVPYPKPTARQRSLFQYYESKHQRGWDYAVKAPAARRLRQTLGRLIRGPQDRGFALILDERAPGLLASEGVECSLMELPKALEAFARWQAKA